MNDWKTRFDILTALVPDAEVKWTHNGQHWVKLDSGKWTPRIMTGVSIKAYEYSTAHIAEFDFVGIAPLTGDEVVFRIENAELSLSKTHAVTPLAKYVRELQKIYDERTAGDYTFSGVLGSFLEAVDTARREAPAAPEAEAGVPTVARATLFRASGKYYTEEDWRIPTKAIGPYDMERSPDFRRIDGGAVLIEAQEPWGFPHLFPGTGGVQ